MSLCQVGILTVPAMDDDAVGAVRAVLVRTGLTAIVVEATAVGAQRPVIEETLRRWCDERELDLLLTVGGTMPAPGPSARETAPEATRAVLERELPGLGELMRRTAVEENPLATLDRGVVGIRGRTLIINLPAGATSASVFLEAIVELIEPILLHLGDDDTAPTVEDGFAAWGDDVARHDAELPAQGDADATDAAGSYGLDAGEFAAFQARLRRGTDRE